MPQWVSREYLARRGSAKFRPGQLTPARTPLLGYTLTNMQVEGSVIPQYFLEVNRQPEIGDDGYDAGARILSDFFKKELAKFLSGGLAPMGVKIIEACLRDGSVADYEALIPL